MPSTSIRQAQAQFSQAQDWIVLLGNLTVKLQQLEKKYEQLQTTS